MARLITSSPLPATECSVMPYSSSTPSSAISNLKTGCVPCRGAMKYKDFVQAVARKMNTDYSPLCWFLLMTFADQSGCGKVSSAEWKIFCAELDKMKSANPFGDIFHSEHFSQVFAKHVGVDAFGYVTRSRIDAFLNEYLQKVDLTIHSGFVESNAAKKSQSLGCDDLEEEMSTCDDAESICEYFLAQDDAPTPLEYIKEELFREGPHMRDQKVSFAEFYGRFYRFWMIPKKKKWGDKRGSWSSILGRCPCGEDSRESPRRQPLPDYESF